MKTFFTLLLMSILFFGQSDAKELVSDAPTIEQSIEKENFEAFETLPETRSEAIDTDVYDITLYGLSENLNTSPLWHYSEVSNTPSIISIRPDGYTGDINAPPNTGV